MAYDINLTGDWRTCKAVLAALPADLDRAIDIATRALAEYYVGKIKKKMASNVPPENSPFTLLFKKSTKTLINNGDLRNSVTAVPGEKKGSMFIGIPRTTRVVRKKGVAAGSKSVAPSSAASTIASQANLADILENGRTITMKMTPKQIKYLHAVLGRKVVRVRSKDQKGTGVIVIHIPARPFIKPTFDEELAGAPKRFADYLRGALKTKEAL